MFKLIFFMYNFIFYIIGVVYFIVLNLLFFFILRLYKEYLIFSLVNIFCVLFDSFFNFIFGYIVM